MNKQIITAVAAVAMLTCGAAAAQSAPDSAPASASVPLEAQNQTAPSPDEHAMPVSATSSALAGSSVTVDAYGVRHILIASAPVPDTLENRAKYGGPMSHAGQHTQPAGN
jgi:hypothetical protein